MFARSFYFKRETPDLGEIAVQRASKDVTKLASETNFSSHCSLISERTSLWLRFFSVRYNILHLHLNC